MELIFIIQFSIITFLGLLFFTTLCASIVMSELKEKHKMALYWLSGVTTFLLILLALVLIR